jgi:class 3 adenylate cyclase/tetratricopeptide (TPR) repeat protein
LADGIEKWLAGLGLAKYGPLFVRNEIDLDILPDLTEQDLKDLEIPLGPRKKLMKAIAAFDGAAVSAAKPEPAARNEAERRQLTVMFCDLVGSTSLSARFDPEDLREIIRAYQEACAKVIEQYGGYVAKYLGDGILVYFGYPQAHENDAERAVHAGLGIVKAVAALGALDARCRGLDLAVRVGINTGLVVVGDIIGEGAAEQASVVGETPNVAARLQELAGANQITLGPLTRELVRSKFDCESLGSNVFHGITNPVAAWRVLRERSDDVSDGAGETNSRPMVGRQEELGLLLRSWDASKKGNGQVVLIQGEAGIGKSRLVDTLRSKLESDHAWVAIRCSPYHANSTLYPIIEHLKRAIGWRAEDDDAGKLAKLESALKAQSLELQRVVPLYAELLMLPLPPDRYPPMQVTPQEQREQTLDALAGWLLEAAERKPVLHVWEDLHWADPTTLELLRLCIEQCPTVAVMNVLTYRADFAAPWTMRSHMTLITLARLNRDEVEGLMLQRAGGKAMPAEVIEYVARKTDGVPLYVEELTKAILEADFVRDAGDRYELTRPLSGITIPATLQDLLMARLDRLPTIREVAQLGSILGREFAYEMLQAIASLDTAALENGLHQLVNSELLYQRGRGLHARYVFKHALVQDAAYHSLLKRTRQFYHHQIADLLETRHPEIVRTQPELLAHHYSRAEDDEKALHYFAAIAEKSAAIYAHAEAVVALEDARRHADRLSGDNRDSEVLALVVRQVHSLHFLGRRQEMVEVLDQQRDRLERTSDRSLIAEYYFWLGFAHAWLGHREQALAYLRHSLAEANEVGDLAIAGRVHRALATEYVYSGKLLAEAVTHGREAVALLERTEDRFWLSQALFTLSYCCIFAGDFASALEAAARLNEFGDAGGIRRAQANAAMLAGLAHAMRGEGKRAVELCRRALDMSPDDFETAFILACLGRACVETGDIEAAVGSLEKAVGLADRVRSVQFRAWFRTMLGEAYLASGALEKATTVAREALDASGKMQFVVGVGLSRQLLGRIAWAQGNFAKAEQEFNDAVAALAAVGALYELARARLALAEIARARGNEIAAVEHDGQARRLFADLGLRETSGHAANK